jgi:signal transduction histidine kinase/ActR/RegA family two-component response regulator
VLVIGNMALSSSSYLDRFSTDVDQSLDERVDQIREQAAQEQIRSAMFFSLFIAAGVAIILYHRVPQAELIAWLVARLTISAGRIVYSSLYLSGRLPSQLPTRQHYRLLALVDGLAWSALGWYFTPVQQLDVAVVTVSVLIGVASIATVTLQVDMPSLRAFVTPILLPNSVYILNRHDDLGWFGFLAVLGLLGVLLFEARRSNERVAALIRLRLQNEQVAQAQAQALAQARLLNEAKGRFVATMSHEMRTPLHGILGLVRLLRERERDAEATRQLDLIRSASDHLVHVINDVLDFSRMEAGSLPLHQEPFGLLALLDEMARTFEVIAHDKGLRLEANLQVEPAHWVTGDPMRVRQVLHNLLGNAVKFTPGGQVRLHARYDPATGEVIIQVEDSGIGIPPQELARVFEAFHQAEGTYQRRFGGTGLGLTISRELCQSMGGDLSCSSELGKGSVFTFRLPLPLAEPATSPANGLAQPEAASDCSHAHVLLVEDNAVNALVAEAELRRLGIEVTVMANGRDALAWLEHHRPDLVLMDCEMPELDGIEATRQIRERERWSGRAPVPIVALTANGREAFNERGPGAGMDGYLAKPFRSEDLARVLAKHLTVEPCPG